VPKIIVSRGNLGEEDAWGRHRLAYNMDLWNFSNTYAVNTMSIDQTIAGIKTFDNFPVVPVGFPIEDSQVANKFYVDFISRTSVIFENLSSNGDVGANADQVAKGDHSHVNLPGDDQKDAMDTSQSPGAANPFVTFTQFSLHASRHVILGQDKIDEATPTIAGLMSATDKIKLDSL